MTPGPGHFGINEIFTVSHPHFDRSRSPSRTFRIVLFYFAFNLTCKCCWRSCSMVFFPGPKQGKKSVAIERARHRAQSSDHIHNRTNVTIPHGYTPRRTWVSASPLCYTISPDKHIKMKLIANKLSGQTAFREFKFHLMWCTHTYFKIANTTKNTQIHRQCDRYTIWICVCCVVHVAV